MRLGGALCPLLFSCMHLIPYTVSTYERPSLLSCDYVSSAVVSEPETLRLALTGRTYFTVFTCLHNT